jgi:hypothetical protein
MNPARRFSRVAWQSRLYRPRCAVRAQVVGRRKKVLFDVQVRSADHAKLVVRTALRRCPASPFPGVTTQGRKQSP